MAIVINGSGTVTGLAVGGLPDGTVDDGTVASGIASSKLTGALPAISGASLTTLSTPNFQAKLSTNQTIGNATWTKVALATQSWDSDSAYDTSTYRFTVPSGKDGLYLFTAGVGIEPGLSETKTALINLYLGGSRLMTAGYRLYGDQAASRLIVTPIWILDLAAGNYVELYFYHEDGGNLDLSSTRTTFSSMRLGD